MTENPLIGAILTGGDFQGLAVLRSLASKGIPVVLLDHEHSISKYSKYKKKCFHAPSPYDSEAYIKYLIELVEKENLKDWVIFPNSDQIVYNIAKYRDTLIDYLRIPVPKFETINKVHNKNITYQICEDNGIPIPKTYFAGELKQLLEMNLEYPLVIKPAVRDHFYSKIKTKAYKINNEEELINIHRFVNKYIPKEEILVQQYINGGAKHLYSCCPFFKDGKIISSISARRSRQHPMDFGHATTFAELVDIPELKNLAEKFLSLINYYGVCEVEFMYDEFTREYKLLEVNPRVWGWHSLAIGAGVDLPYMLYLDILNKELPKLSILKNLKWIRFTTDTVTVIKEILKRKLKLSEYINSIKGEKVFAVFSWKDPLPFIAELFLIPYLWKKRGF